MPQTNNLEPRRFWRYARRRHSGAWRAELEDSTRCTTCGSAVQVDRSRGVPFCQMCLEHATQANLDEDYDDLGCPD